MVSRAPRFCHEGHHQLTRPILKAHDSRWGIRNFHASTSSRFLESVLTDTHTVLSGLHSVIGLPWVATLPLAAILIRAIFITPLSVYTRKSQQRQLELQPLISAWDHNIRKKVIKRSGQLGPIECATLAKKETVLKRKELYRRWSCSTWKNWLPIAQIPVFLTVVETIRRMCGTHEGLLGLMAKPWFEGLAVEANREEALKALDTDAGWALSIEQSFSQEGGLWFRDLLVPDPLLILPFLLSGSLLMNIYYGSWSARSVSTNREPTVLQRRLTNALKVLALMIAPVTLQLPSAMLVYWISSSVSSTAQNILLDKFMPLTPPVKACKPTGALDSEIQQF
ncbi:MAG: hypothetical protein M1827_002924 [Pycnora praestabilis]|nr:MAG: hypothetical protein M1827_002924 [Pycnora praestabilis]